MYRARPRCTSNLMLSGPPPMPEDSSTTRGFLALETIRETAALPSPSVEAFGLCETGELLSEKGPDRCSFLPCQRSPAVVGLGESILDASLGTGIGSTPRPRLPPLIRVVRMSHRHPRDC